MYQKECLYETNYFINKFSGSAEASQVKDGVAAFKLRIKTIEPQDYSQPIGYLAGVKEVSQVQIPSALIPQEQMEKEMLILAGITGICLTRCSIPCGKQVHLWITRQF